jgi:hypothetical protein
VAGANGGEVPRSQKFLLGDRIQATALDVLEALIEATYIRDRRGHLAAPISGNRLRGLRGRWRAGTVAREEVEVKVRAWIAHAENADTWRLRQAVFGKGWFGARLRRNKPLTFHRALS